jgi:excisionase family DNA binding protein
MAVRPKEMAAWLGEYWGIEPEPTPALSTDGPLSVAQAAEKMGVSARKVYDLVAAGELGHHKVGRIIKIRPEDIAAFQSQLPAEKPNDPYRHFRP